MARSTSSGASSASSTSSTGSTVAVRSSPSKVQPTRGRRIGLRTGTRSSPLGGATALEVLSPELDDLPLLSSFPPGSSPPADISSTSPSSRGTLSFASPFEPERSSPTPSPPIETARKSKRPSNRSTVKRKADESLDAASPSKRPKQTDDSPENARQVSKASIGQLQEKPAVIEERNGEIEFRVVNNDGSRESIIILTGLKCIFQKQLPKMPKDYIARLVYDRTHLSMAIVKKPLEVVGGITYRPFKGRQFAEIVFCAISSDQQVKGYGAHLMSHLKDYVKATSDVMHFLTYADNYAIGYFKKQGFTKEITLSKPRWMGYIKDYEGGTIMQCSMVPKIRYLESQRMLTKQKCCVDKKIKAISNSYKVHPPPSQWKNGVHPIDPLTIPAIKASGWSPSMDELARAPRHGPNYNQLLHLLNSLQNNSNAWPFIQPVNKDEVQDYYDVITNPMDLSTMEEKLEKDQYETAEEFLRDAKLVFDNCRKYNSESTPYAKAANRLEKFMWGRVREVPEWAHLEAELGSGAK
ncbi:hypothetical protein W97_08720 [Coniosporium apollinis CBS 100218]|uniref:histone acetyltransferase n=1 Tax=Coniosporium apollinis (strain CBS 100218) TaxID=1168221 RepID=R7Z5J5_CONA1|nr:uncharacterized protein W97_08720 [Coniosporium apollinis CBS 100218]EON69460.1 hypothetical protein W97_08720 [Coniosporium apollinis CBS 100218]